MKYPLFKIGNVFYRYTPALYRAAYTLYKAHSDRAERQLIRSYLHPGMTVLDLGANIGTSASFLADLVGPTGKVYAFEPAPSNFAMLSNALSSRSNIELIRAAVGEHTGTLTLHLSDDLNVDHHAYDAGEGRTRCQVAVYRLDDFIAEGTRVDFIKSDIQGFELHALRGAKRVLTENRNIRLLLEFWPFGLRRAGTSPDALLGFLGDLGFRCRVVAAGIDKQPFEVGDEEYVNLFAARD